MRYLIFCKLALLFLLTAPAAAQFHWAQGIGGSQADETMDICSDNAGNIISAGYFSNTLQYGMNTLISSGINIPDIYVSKSSPAGNPIWAVKAGGSGSDRALSVASDAGGNIYITGFYYGTASFGPFTLSSVNGTKDVFIAKLDVNGNFLWARSAGGNMADMGNGIAVDPQGNVAITGQYEGTATFGASTFTSVMHPTLNAPSIDVFTTKLDANGNFLWTRTGAAKYTDRGLDIISNSNGELYVCGQFSDTITFGQAYNNPVMNAIFLMKYDPSGNEIWFRKASGTYSIAYSLALNSNGDVFMTGDYQGTLAFYGTPNNFLNDNFSKRAFLVKYNSGGIFQWASSVSSDNPISARHVAIDPQGSAYLYGEFRCTLGEFSAIYGPGTFNSIGFQDLFIVKFDQNGLRQWERNFGGPKNDNAHGLLVPAPDAPVMAGSYDSRILWPVNSISVTNGTSFNPSVYNGSYCNDPSYGNYEGLRGKGYSDGFIASAIDLNREPYDYYYRTGSSCVRDFVGGCIEERDHLNYACTDTFMFCEKGALIANTFTGVLDSVGPYYRYQWSSSSLDTLHYDSIFVTGMYSVVMTTLDGCYTSQDTAYAQVNPKPGPPTITDDHGFNLNQTKWANNFGVCMPDSILLATGNYSSGDTVKWYYGLYNNSNIPLTVNDSLITTGPSGWYYTVITTPFGCTDTNRLHLSFDNPLPPLVPRSGMPDTIQVCSGLRNPYIVYDSLTNPTGHNPVSLYWIGASYSVSPSTGMAIELDTITSLNGEFLAWISGTYFITQTIYYENACGVDTFYLLDTITIIVNPVPSGQITISGPTEMCQGDTLMLGINVPAPMWPGVTVTSFPPAPALAVTQPVNILATVWLTDTITGCCTWDTTTHIVQYKADPEIITVPASGLICPTDSVLMTCNIPGYNYQWIGPSGILPYTTQSVYASTPGFYHCIVLDLDSCVLTSKPAELKQYNTPYLVSAPGNLVCLGQSVTLQVITNDSTLIQWNAPLSGGGTTRTVTQPGTYTCDVTMCGITTVCSMQVIMPQVIAQITTPVQSLCPNDSVWLTANSGMAAYQWSTGATTDSVLVAAGTHMLTTFDVSGCFTEDTVTIALDTSVAAPVVSGVTVCLGDSAILFAVSSGPVEWYTAAAGGPPIFSGNPYTTPPITTAATYYAATYDSTGCHSLRVPAAVTISPSSIPPAIAADTLVCSGDSISLAADTVANVTYSWTGPNGFSSSLQSLVISNADTSNTGVYSVVISSATCTSAPSSVFVQVVLPASPQLSYDDSLCIGDAIIITDTSGIQNATYYWTGPNSFTGLGASITIPNANPSMSGTYSVYLNAGGCQSNASSASITVLPPGPVPVISGPASVCENDTILLQGLAPGASSFYWTTPLGVDSSQNILIPSATGNNSGIYTLTVLSAAGCVGPPAQVNVVVNGLPVFSLGNDSTVCFESNYQIQGPAGFSSYLWNDSSASSSIIADTTGTYSLTVTDANGCSATDSIYMDVTLCSVRSVNVFSPNGDGINDRFTIVMESVSEIEVIVYNRYGSIEHQWTGADGYWDGTNSKQNKPVPEGTYFYTARVVTLDGQKMELTGHVFLTR